MYVYLTDQFAFLAASFLLGIVMGAVYDVFRIIRLTRGVVDDQCSDSESVIGAALHLSSYNAHLMRRRNRQRNSRLNLILFFAEDLICSAIFVLAVLGVVYSFNYGVARAFSFAGMIGGFVIWRFTAGRLLMTVSKYLIYIVGAILYYLFYPLRLLLIKIKKVIYKLYKVLYNRIAERKAVHRAEKEISIRRKHFRRISENCILMEKK